MKHLARDLLRMGKHSLGSSYLKSCIAGLRVNVRNLCCNKLLVLTLELLHGLSALCVSYALSDNMLCSLCNNTAEILCVYGNLDDISCLCIALVLVGSLYKYVGIRVRYLFNNIFSEIKIERHIIRVYVAENDILTAADEAQTGGGRTGAILTSMRYGVKPDITTLAKGIAGGVPMGACLADEKCAGVLVKGTHGSTFGGNPVVSAGANDVEDRIDQRFLANENARAGQLRTGLAKLPMVKSISGIGLMVGIEFFGNVKAADVLAACREKGLLVLTAKTRLRLLPPLTLTAHDVELALTILNEVLSEMAQKSPEEQA